MLKARMDGGESGKLSPGQHLLASAGSGAFFSGTAGTEEGADERAQAF